MNTVERSVSETISDRLDGVRETARKARLWLAWTEACVEYYEEWQRTGEVPDREFPKLPEDYS